eukprot:TRINITY_DN5874_c0_g1_i3.p1 TRINITY_DN5874_c0_g1~~TRINITY_DN5874_c0_g1_i3.p1  ORF type:complete len:363 (+),score=106.31 TRINITY_DN5874_c0_g1_i3:137-1090(+)
MKTKSKIKREIKDCIAESNKAVDLMADRVEDLNAKIIKFKKANTESISEKVKELVKLRKMLKEQENYSLNETQNFEAMKSEKEKVEQEHAHLKNQYATLKAEFENTSNNQVEEINRLKKELNKKCIENANLITSLKEGQRANQDVERELNEWKQKYEELKQQTAKDKADAIERYEQLTSENTQSIQKIKLLEHNIEALKETYNKDSADIELENKVQLRDRESKLRSLKIERDSLLQKVNELKRTKATTPILPANKEAIVKTSKEEAKVIVQPAVQAERLKLNLPQKESESENLLPSDRLMKKLEGIELAAKYALEDL